ncbi:MAG: hypothetical protein PHU64_02170 [Candidatus Omnitrophica bacterium]|nr:hypothetical protein [Candidatus Omnitrophota bacterium]MDD5430556.1 hypothetical protein [Candidatus Omnitrophota bacterium]
MRGRSSSKKKGSFWQLSIFFCALAVGLFFCLEGFTQYVNNSKWTTDENAIGQDRYNTLGPRGQVSHPNYTSPEQVRNGAIINTHSREAARTQEIEAKRHHSGQQSGVTGVDVKDAVTGTHIGVFVTTGEGGKNQFAVYDYKKETWVEDLSKMRLSDKGLTVVAGHGGLNQEGEFSWDTKEDGDLAEYKSTLAEINRILGHNRDEGEYQIASYDPAYDNPEYQSELLRKQNEGFRGMDKEEYDSWNGEPERILPPGNEDPYKDYQPWL